MANVPKFDVSGLDFNIRKPEAIPMDEYSQMMAIGEAGFKSIFTEATDEQVAAAVGSDKGVEHYAATRVDPSLVEGFLPNQEWTAGSIITVHDQGEVKGFMTAYYNVSGSEKARKFKKVTSISKYVHVRELAVAEEYQHRGLGHVLGYVGLGPYVPWVRSTGYVYKGTPKVAEAMQAVGYRLDEKSTRPVEVYPGKTVEQERYVGWMTKILHKLMMLPDSDEAYRAALSKVRSNGA